jgi:hypothetical protein
MEIIPIRISIAKDQNADFVYQEKPDIFAVGFRWIWNSRKKLRMIIMNGTILPSIHFRKWSLSGPELKDVNCSFLDRIRFGFSAWLWCCRWFQEGTALLLLDRLQYWCWRKHLVGFVSTEWRVLMEEF